MMRAALIVLAFAYAPTVYAGEAALYVSPESGTYTIGELFEIEVFADTDGQRINAAEAELTFNPNAIEVQKISTDESILDSWPTVPTFSNQKGNIRFAGWTKTPYNGSRGLLVTIQFRALRSESSNAYLAAGAMLAADDRGSNIITSMRSGLYTIGPEHIVPEPLIDDEGAATSSDPVEDLVADLTEGLPAAPVFDPHPGIVELGERIVVTGTAPPNSKVLFFFGEGDDTDSSAVTSDADGAFMFVSDLGAEEGVYRLRAVTQDADGRTSHASRLTITTRSGRLVAAAAVSADVAGALIPILTLLVIGGLGGGYLYHVHTLETMKRGGREKRR
jgi:hypothetical protein